MAILTRRVVAAFAVVLLAAAGGCSGDADSGERLGPPPVPRIESVPLGDRPFTLHVPSAYREGTAVPLLVLLHGYTSSGAGQEAYLKIAPEAERRGHPVRHTRWHHGSAARPVLERHRRLLQPLGSTVDDSAYLADVIAAVSSRYSVDAARVYLVGHSNGAFMSFRMACDHADLIAAIAALNGAMLDDVSECQPSQAGERARTFAATRRAHPHTAAASSPGSPYPSTADYGRRWVAPRRLRRRSGHQRRAARPRVAMWTAPRRR